MYALCHICFSFMSGGKHRGHLPIEEPQTWDPSSAQINFVVPTRSYLDNIKELLPKEEIVPGILSPMLDCLVSTGEGKPHKICVDGKKINPSTEHTFGAVNLFGFEESPTAKEINDREVQEIEQVDRLVDNIVKESASPSVGSLLHIMKILGNRTMQLRILALLLSRCWF